LTDIVIPRSVAQIGSVDTFVGCSKLKIHCVKGSFAHTYAVQKDIPFVLYTDEPPQIPKYNITYNANKATGGSVPTDKLGYEENSTATVRGNTGQLVRKDYTFAGWSINAAGTGKTYQPGDEIQIGKANVVLYAKWNKAPVIAKKQLAKPTKLTFAKQKASWKKVKNNNGYTLVIKQGSKTVKTVQIKKNKTSYKIPKNLLKKGKKYSFTLVAKGTGNYKNSKVAKSKVLKIK